VKGDGPGTKVVVEFWHAMSGDHEKLVADFANEFNAKSSEYEIKPVYQGRYDQLKMNLANALATGGAPAMAQVYEGWTSIYLDKGHLTPVADFIAKEADGYKDTLADIYPIFLENNTWDGTLLTLPFNKSSYAIFVNRDRLEKAGYTEFPKSPKDFEAACEKMTERNADGSVNVYGVGIRSMIESFTVQYYAYGGRYMDMIDGNMTVVDTPIARRALSDMVRFNTEKKIAYVDGDYMSQPFGSDKVACFWASSAGIPFVAKGVAGKFRWEAAPMPDGSPSGTDGKFLLQGTNIAILNKASEDAQAGAWQFLKYLMEPEQMALWSAKSGYLPVRRAARDVEILRAELEKNQAFRVCVEGLDRGAFEPRAAYWEEIRAELAGEIEAALRGAKSVEEALMTAEKKARRVIAQHEED